MLLNAQDQTEEDPFMLKEINDSCNKISSAKIEEVVFLYLPIYMCLIQRRIQNRWRFQRRFCENNSAINYFCKNLHLRCLKGF